MGAVHGGEDVGQVGDRGAQTVCVEYAAQVEDDLADAG